jgi:Kef-type K+ transport system membrane component KefB/nucleotide-binding universal stress UspA family protein
MPFLLNIQIPLKEPVIIITLVLLLLLIGPAFFERLRIPSIVGLLVSGAIIGPNGFNLLSPNLEFSLLGTMGLLYLMFLAGLEIDLIDFIENKLKSLFVGLASFFIPFITGLLICRFVLDYELLASWLIAAMLSSHTLVSYPILGRLGIVNKSIVTIVIGATIIADILALVTMEFITNYSKQGFDIDVLLILLLQFSIFLMVVLLILPRLSSFFLQRYEGELAVQYIFVLLILFVASSTAHFLEIEPILGAFFCGLTMNRQILRTSPLYKRIEFIGNTLFIPFFLISIGILANFKIYIHQPRLLFILIILTLTAIAGKYLAALLSRLVLRTSTAETNLIFGLSVGRAASAIAIILIGFNMRLVSEDVLNNTVILILFTSITSSYITQRSGRKILIKSNDTISKPLIHKQKLLVPVANPSNMAQLLEFASLIRDTGDDTPVYPLLVFPERENDQKKIREKQQEVKKVIDILDSEVEFHTGTRIDNNITNGIVRAADEMTATSIIMGWHTRTTPFSILFGDVLNNLLEKTHRMVIVLKTPSTIRDVRKVLLFVTADAHLEKGFSQWLDATALLAKRLQIKFRISSSSISTIQAAQSYLDEKKLTKYFDYKEMAVQKPKGLSLKTQSADMMAFVHARRGSVSYSRHFEHFMNNCMGRFKGNNIIIIYPEQAS